MTSEATLSALAEVQRALTRLTDGLDEAALRGQHHPELSPLGWHLGHCGFIERYWVGERLLGDRSATAGLHDLYFPEISPKRARGGRLPEPPRLFTWLRDAQAETLAVLADPPGHRRNHPLLRDDYLGLFLLQHHAQHVEIMRMVLSQYHGADPHPGAHLTARPLSRAAVTLPAGQYEVGDDSAAAYDNEQPRRRVRLGAARLARRPVRNSEWLAFMEDGGYEARRWWSAAGWRWHQDLSRAMPDGWRRGARGWYGIGPDGAAALDPDGSVLGISRHEAEAFARWAGARLPHEYEWEAARRLDLLEGVGEAWEWCANRFHPYPGFRPFPYDGYSLPWFDGAHYVLRGASLHTLTALRRAGFRNFYTQDKRHIFAGLRLVFGR